MNTAFFLFFLLTKKFIKRTILVPCQDRQSFADDSMFKRPGCLTNNNPDPDYLFKPTATTQLGNDSIFGQMIPESEMSMFKQPSLFKNSNSDADYLFKRTAETAQPGNDSIFGQMIPESDMSLFRPQAATNFDQSQQLSSGDDEASFKSGNAFINDLDSIEAQNRREFASNNLTVLSTGNCQERTSEKWWNLSIQQTSKLEVSAMSNSFDKKVYAVDDYFNQKSEMPQYLADKEHGVNISDDNKKPEREEEQQQTPGTPSERQTSPDENNCNEMSYFTLSTSNMNTLLSTGRTTSNNFSFTLNSSDTGEFIQRKVATTAGNDVNPSPFQITKMVNKKQIESSLAAEKEASSMKLNPSNLRTIGEELDRVSNRLAHKNTTQVSEFKVPEVPKLPTEGTAAATVTTKNDKLPETLLPQMDETISSINTTSNVTAGGGNILVSLTSTPSKLKTAG